jgi:hypothetical protein
MSWELAQINGAAMPWHAERQRRSGHAFVNHGLNEHSGFQHYICTLLFCRNVVRLMYGRVITQQDRCNVMLRRLSRDGQKRVESIWRMLSDKATVQYRHNEG